jgi:hypothetical protein
MECWSKRKLTGRYCFLILVYRMQRWYILLVSFAIFPLTLDLSLGCQFIVIKSANDDGAQLKNQAFGLFRAAVYDDADGDFLGCVDFSNSLKHQINDIGYRLSRYAGGFLLAFTIMASLVCICSQCFTKSGKSFLWNVMRFSYTCACLCQGAMYVIFSSEICTTFQGVDSQCFLGRNGVAGVFNFTLLLGMVIATLFSFPPRHPVFQCWGSDPQESDEEVSTDPEDEEFQREREIEAATSAIDSANESVSLFGNSRASRSVKSTNSVKISSRSVKSHSRSVSDSRSSLKSSQSRLTATKEEADSKISLKAGKTNEDDKFVAVEAGTMREEDRMDRSVYRDETPSGLELTMDEGLEGFASLANNEEVAEPISGNGSTAESKSVTGSIGSIASRMWKRNIASKSDASDNQSTQSSFKEVSKRVSNIETEVQAGRAKPVTPNDVHPSPIMSYINLREVPDPEARSKSYPVDFEDSDSIKFLRQLAAVTKLAPGGLRVKTTEQDHRIEMVDEYPAKAGEGLNAPHSSDGADLVRVRTEYYDQGSRTTKEVTHHDGSRTVVTIIDSNAGGSTHNLTDTDSISTKNTNVTSQGQRSNVLISKSSASSVNSIVSRAVSIKPESVSQHTSIGKVDSNEKSQTNCSLKSEGEIESSTSRPWIAWNSLSLDTKGGGSGRKAASDVWMESVLVSTGSKTESFTGSKNSGGARESQNDGQFENGSTNAESRTSSKADSKGSRTSASKSSNRSSRNKK